MSLKRLLKKETDDEIIVRLVKEAEAGEANHDESNWLVSYADMMTLLCGFFIMLFSMAKLDEPQYEIVKREVAKAFKGQYENPAEGQGKFASRIIQEAGLDRDTTVQVDSQGMTLTFQSVLFFDTLSAEVSPGGQALLTRIIDAIFNLQAKEHRLFRIVVEGHTDGRPVLSGTFATNWELSAIRATRVVRMFQDKGFLRDRLTAIGYGDTRPLATERRPDGTLDEAAMGKNRRVVLRILEPTVETIPFANAQVEMPSDAAAAHSPAAEVPAESAKSTD
jgi:chemotaxis protein MotB